MAGRMISLGLLGLVVSAKAQCQDVDSDGVGDDSDSDGICDVSDSCRFDSSNDADGDGVCTQCCGIYLGPNGGNDGEYEVQVDLSNGDPPSGTYTIRAYVYTSSDWDGTERLLHARAWDSGSSVITAIGSDDAGALRDEWNWVEASMAMGDSVPYRVSLYLGYPMQSSAGYVLFQNVQFIAPDGTQWVPENGDVQCGYGVHEGAYHGSSDSYGNVGVAENACNYDGFEFGHLFNCNDIDSDFVCSPDDDCFADGDNDQDGDNICGDVDPCPADPYDDAEGDGVCTQCCGIYLGPNSGNNGEWEVQVDLSGEAPGVPLDAISGVYTIRANVYTTGDYDGSTQLLHARAWDSAGNVITAIGGDGGTAVRDEWNWIEADIDCGDSTPYRVSIYFGYPMQNENGYVFLDELLLVDSSGQQFIPDQGYVDCTYGIHEGDYHGSSDSYGNIGIMENACEYDGFKMAYLDNCNDIDSDGICTPEDSCWNDPNNDADGDGYCSEIDSELSALTASVDDLSNAVDDNKDDISNNTMAISDLYHQTIDINNAIADVMDTLEESNSALTLAAADGSENSFLVADGDGVSANEVTGDDSIVLGGFGNSVDGTGSTLAGGRNNLVQASYGTVAGGNRNAVVSNFASILGGYSNRASGKFASVLGGSRSAATGRHSFTIGSLAEASASYSGTINLSGGSCKSENENELLICADGVVIQTGNKDYVDLAGLARRALDEEAAPSMAEFNQMRSEVESLKQTVERLTALLSKE